MMTREKEIAQILLNVGAVELSPKSHSFGHQELNHRFTVITV